MRTRLWQTVKELFFPTSRSCPFCARPLDLYEQNFCETCATLLRTAHKEQKHCLRCGRFMAHGELCSTCAANPPPFEAARAVCRHEELARDVLHRFKYQGMQHLAVPMACLMALTAIEQPDMESCHWVTFVPTTRSRLQERGYNQAELLAVEVGKQLGLPTRPLLEKHMETVSLTKLSRLDRRRALAGVFQGSETLNGQKVLLVDDVYTTGSTSAACSKALLANGAEGVWVLTFSTAWMETDKYAAKV